MKFEFDKKSGTMQPKKNDQIYFAKSMGGGLRIDDHKNNVKYIVEKDGDITIVFGRTDSKFPHIYDYRDAHVIAERVMRLLGAKHIYANYKKFMKGMNESTIVKKFGEFILESSIRDRSGYVNAVEIMANNAMEMFGLDEDNVYNLCVNGIDDFNYISKLINFYIYKDCDNITSQEEFLDLYKSSHNRYDDELDKYINDNYQDILSDDELEDVYDDIDVDAIINKRNFGGGGYEAKIDFVNACVYKIIDIIKNNHEI